MASDRRRTGPPRLSSGEKLLRLLRADIQNGRITASTDAASTRLDALAEAAGRMLDGEDPGQALGLVDGGRANDYSRDRDIALRVHSELKKRGAARSEISEATWNEVHGAVHAWLGTAAAVEHVPPDQRHRYGARPSLKHMKRIYREHRTLCESWDLLLG